MCKISVYFSDMRKSYCLYFLNLVWGILGLKMGKNTFVLSWGMPPLTGGTLWRKKIPDFWFNNCTYDYTWEDFHYFHINLKNRFFYQILTSFSISQWLLFLLIFHYGGGVFCIFLAYVHLWIFWIFQTQVNKQKPFFYF